MKKITFIVLVFFWVLNGQSQERIFSVGYAKAFVDNDSTAITIAIDLNRVPAQSEKTGSYYIINEAIDKGSWGWYIKPTADINVGSSVTSAPNNIAVGAPIGLVYDIPKTKLGIFTWYTDVAPEIVADKEITNNLYYLSANTYVRYEVLKDVLFNIVFGLSYANGVRDQSKIGESDSYSRVTIPLYSILKCWTVSYTDKNGKAIDFKRISWINSFKYNHIYSDGDAFSATEDYRYFNSKIDFYLTKNLGLNVTYNNGYEEPVFKRNHSLSLGITLAR